MNSDKKIDYEELIVGITEFLQGVAGSEEPSYSDYESGKISRDEYYERENKFEVAREFVQVIQDYRL